MSASRAGKRQQAWKAFLVHGVTCPSCWQDLPCATRDKLHHKYRKYRGRPQPQ